MRTKTFAWGLVLLGGLVSMSGTTYAAQNCQEVTFTTTAYYSPLPNQEFYIKGNEEADKYLNGQGTHGASGQPVAPGMIAAPSSYEFGGTIEIPGLGRGVIRDRGGAIVHAGERNNIHDRIDVWMGHGEEGLIRALLWGKQDVTATYCEGNQYQEPSFSRDDMTIYKNFFDMSIIRFTMQEGRKDPFVRKLQEYLMTLGHLQRTSPTGYFGPETTKAICEFQVENNVVDSPASERCGVFGPQTRSALNEVLKQQGLYPRNFREIATVEDIIQDARSINQLIAQSTTSSPTTSQTEAPTVEEKAVVTTETSIASLQDNETILVLEESANPPTQNNEQIIFGKKYKIGESGFEIIYLQELLIEQGFFKGDITGVFTEQTNSALQELQDIYDDQDADYIIANLRNNFVASK